VQAIKFVQKVADIAQQHNHHPDIDIRYNKVMITTTTHDDGDTITPKDIQLIDAIE